MNKLFSIFFVSIVISFSCKSKEKVSQTDSSSAADTILLASIERTPCFGKCATYKISIYQSGYVVYEGKQHVKNIGLFSAQLDKSKVEEIKKFISQNKILEMNDDYRNPHIADYPGVITEALLNGKYKYIAEADPQAPKEIKAFQKFLDSFFNDETSWIPLKDGVK
ncbi:MAG: DUF6438 domain-containing protein [Bacteroidia bacterium]